MPPQWQLNVSRVMPDTSGVAYRGQATTPSSGRAVDFMRFCHCGVRVAAACFKGRTDGVGVAMGETMIDEDRGIQNSYGAKRRCLVLSTT